MGDRRVDQVGEWPGLGDKGVTLRPFCCGKYGDRLGGPLVGDGRGKPDHFELAWLLHRKDLSARAKQ